MKVSFDFDGTLDKPSVQTFVKSLLQDGVDVWVCTTRHKTVPVSRGMSVDKDTWNVDLFDTLDTLGIDKKKVIFTNGNWKWNYLKNQGFVFHLDDDWTEVKHINSNTEVVGISNFGNPTWQQQLRNIISLV